MLSSVSSYLLSVLVASYMLFTTEQSTVMAPLLVKSRRQVMRMKNKAVKNVTPSYFTICNSLQTEIVQQVEFNTVA